MKKPLVAITLSAPILVSHLHDLHRVRVDVASVYAAYHDEVVIQAPAEHHHPHNDEPEAPIGPLRMPKPEVAVTSVALTGQSMTASTGSMEIHQG